MKTSQYININNKCFPMTEKAKLLYVNNQQKHAEVSIERYDDHMLNSVLTRVSGNFNTDFRDRTGL